jgi:hypothetical protein
VYEGSGDETPRISGIVSKCSWKINVVIKLLILTSSFAIYLTVPCAVQATRLYRVRGGRIVVNDELERMRKEEIVVTLIEAVCRYLSGRTEENHRNFVLPDEIRNRDLSYAKRESYLLTRLRVNCRPSIRLCDARYLT